MKPDDWRNACDVIHAAEAHMATLEARITELEAALADQKRLNEEIRSFWMADEERREWQDSVLKLNMELADMKLHAEELKMIERGLNESLDVAEQERDAAKAEAAGLKAGIEKLLGEWAAWSAKCKAFRARQNARGDDGACCSDTEARAAQSCIDEVTALLAAAPGKPPRKDTATTLERAAQVAYDYAADCRDSGQEFCARIIGDRILGLAATTGTSATGEGEG